VFDFDQVAQLSDKKSKLRNGSQKIIVMDEDQCTRLGITGVVCIDFYRLCVLQLFILVVVGAEPG
jgi:hypothetical protein